MKFFGILLVIMAGFGIGRFYSRRVYRRVEILRRTDCLLERFLCRLEFAGEPLAELWRSLAKEMSSSALPFVFQVAENLNAVPFAEAFCLAVDELELPEEDKRLLREFGNGCGKFDLDGQRHHIQGYRQRLQVQLKDAQRQADAKGKVYTAVGSAGGVCLALLLL